MQPAQVEPALVSELRERRVPRGQQSGVLPCPLLNFASMAVLQLDRHPELSLPVLPCVSRFLAEANAFEGISFLLPW